MTTISLTYNEEDVIARKTIEYILSLGLFKEEKEDVSAKEETLQAISDAKEGRNVTVCPTFEDYLKAVAE